MKVIVDKVAAELGLESRQVEVVVQLLFQDECTVPFVARYRKEKTGSLDEVAIRNIRDRYSYLTELETSKEKYLKTIIAQAEQNPELKKNLPNIQRQFTNCNSKQELEDLYLPYKPKRVTRAKLAKDKGLEPLLEILLKNLRSENILELAHDFVTKNNLDVPNAAQALEGCSDILAERLNETASLRKELRDFYESSAILKSEENKKTTESIQNNPENNTLNPSAQKIQDQIHKYQNYFAHSEPVAKIASHRIMAIRRGESAKILKVNIEVDENTCIAKIYANATNGENASTLVSAWLKQVAEDCFKRLLGPSAEAHVRLLLKQRAEEEAIVVFAKNLNHLLMLPPIPTTVVMGIDPGIRTGCKVALVSENSKYLDSKIIHPNPKNLNSEASLKSQVELLELITKYNVNYIAIGNGTGSKEISMLVSQLLKEKQLTHIKKVIVNESGASIYSTDEIAREEFPDLDASIRSAISIARRLQDPLAELVKIDPRSIGIGQYQHDVNTTKLANVLQDTVETCVNNVGVNLNTASHKLLSYVSGIKSNLAKSIVDHRSQNGAFKSRAELLKVNGFGDKAFEQAAGFLRIPQAENPLDNSRVHPESYHVVENIAQDQNIAVKELVANAGICNKIDLNKYVNEKVGLPTLQDIIQELTKPGRDPRTEGSRLIFSDDVNEISDLKPGMLLPGTVTNVTNFGAFVDIGVHQDGLVHISEISHKFIQDVSNELPVGTHVQVKVIDVDITRNRINLSMKQATPKPEVKEAKQVREAIKPKSQAASNSFNHKNTQNKSQNFSKPSAPQKQHTLDDLVAKFTRR